MINLKAFGLLTVLMLVLGGALAVIGFSTGVWEFAEKTYLQSFDGIGNDTVVTVKNTDGRINIRTWEPGHEKKDQIEVSAVFKTIWGTEILDDADIKVTRGSEFVIESDLRDKARHSVTVRITVRLPDFVSLKTVKTSNGDIDLEGTRGDVYLKTSNGEVDVDIHNGSIEAATSNGRIEVADVKGDIDCDTSNGGIWVRDVRGNVTVKTDNGRIDIRGVDYILKAETSNGDIRADCANISADGMNLDTSNGEIDIHLPANLSFEFDLETSNGAAESHGYLVFYDKLDKDHKIGKVNGGGPKLTADTSNGEVDLYAVEVV